MTYEEACKLIGVDPDALPDIVEMAEKISQWTAHGTGVTIDNLRTMQAARDIIYRHWYSEYVHRRDGQQVIAKHKDGTWAMGSTLREAVLAHKSNPQQPVVLTPDFDWKLACFKIIEGVGEAEGVYFQSFWDMGAEISDAIVQEYEEWRSKKSSR